MQIKRIFTPSPLAAAYAAAKAAAVATLAINALASTAAVFVTPGSLSGYTYFPPSKQSSGSGGGDASGRVEALQKCYVAVKQPDVTFKIAEPDFYGLKSIRVYYKAAGGNGGSGINGGGGGSSAILLNGAVLAIAPGAAGGKTSDTIKGDFQVAPGDTVRVISGGGGGSGVPNEAGGGGGAGWRGGGAGSSTAPGQGGSSVPGQGGAGANPGTPGIDSNGGVSTYPDGNSAPLGNTSGPDYYQQPEDSTTWRRLDAKSPATPTRWGSAGVPKRNNSSFLRDYLPGFGGGWGRAGSPAPALEWSFPMSSTYRPAYFSQTGGTLFVPSCGGYNCSFTQDRYSLSDVGKFPDPTSFELTRVAATNGSQQSGWDKPEISNLPGQVVFMYSAVECTLLK